MKRNIKHILPNEKPIWKSYILHESNCTTFWKRQSYGDSKKTRGHQGLGDRSGFVNRWSRGFLGYWDFSTQCYNDGYMCYTSVQTHTTYICVGVIAVQVPSRVQLFTTPRTAARQAPLSMGLPRQEHWSGLPFPSPGDHQICISCLAGRFFTAEPPGRPCVYIHIRI